MRLKQQGSAKSSGATKRSVLGAASQLALALLAAAIVLPAPAAAAPSASFSFGVAGDFGFGADGQATISLAGGAGLDFFLFVGDTTYGTTNETNWCNAFRAQVPHVLAEAGNHDTGESAGASLGALLAACPYDLTEPMVGSYGREWYVDYPGSAPLVRLVLTGCGVRFDAGNGSQWLCATGDAHYQFVSNAIDGARNASIRWVMVGMHKNCISAGTKSCEIGTDFLNLLLDKKVDLILQGHDHLYQRSKQLVCATPNLYRPECVADDGADGQYVKGGGAVLAIQGTGGQSHYAYNPADSEAGYFASAFDDTYGFVKYTVNATTLSAQFLRSAGGTSNDSFVIGPPAPDATPPALVLTTPANGAVTNRSSIWLAGTTEPGARVSVSGVEATVGADGSFGLLVALRPGPNLLSVTARDAAGNGANATLNVTFEDPLPILEAQLAEARSQLAEAQANLTLAQARMAAIDAEFNATQSKLATAQANVSSAEARLAALQSDANATQAELDDAQANLTAAQANLASTQNKLTALQSDANETRAGLEEARADVTSALGRVSALEVDLRDARAQQNATQAGLDAANARAAAAADQARLALIVAIVAVALAAVGAILALRNRRPPTS